MDNSRLKSALNQIWALVYVGTSRDLNLEQLDQLREAMTVVDEWPYEDPFKGKASWLCDRVRRNGILSMPPRKPRGTEDTIREECQVLCRYLDSN